MALSVQAPRDVSHVKTKVFLNLTARQLLCFGGALLIGLPVFFLIRPTGNMSAAMAAMIAAMLPLFFLAMYEKDGQPLEVVLKHYIDARFRRPKVRPYRTDNSYAKLEKQYDARMEVKRIVDGSISAAKKLFGKKGKDKTDQLPPGLSRAEQRQVRKIMERTAPGRNGIPQTAQESIPFERMFRDGTCRVTPDYYSRTIRFENINYQLASDTEKEAIFEEWCDFLNFFDSSVSFEISFVNTPADAAEFEGRVMIPYQDDPFNDVRAEYTAMLKRQSQRGTMAWSRQNTSPSASMPIP